MTMLMQESTARVALSPVNEVQGIRFKRDDLYRKPNGVNGSKLRACEWLVDRAIRNGAKQIVSAAACVSPQHAIVSTVCNERGIPMTSIIGGTDPLKAVLNHRSVAIASENGASFEAISVGYNPALQKAARDFAARTGAHLLHYGIAIEEDACVADLRGFHTPVAQQTANIDTTDLIVPFGSGNSGVGILYGLAQNTRRPHRVHLMAIGPSRLAWASARLEAMGIKNGLEGLPFKLEVHTLHGTWASYGDRMPAQIGPIKFHPNYEGKIIRYLEKHRPPVWERRDGSVGFWIVGGQL